jgi:hypothetical protein
MIRPATTDDLPAIAEMGLTFTEEGKLPAKVVPLTWCRSWANLLASGAGVVLVSEQNGEVTGAIAGLLYHDLNDGAPVLAEAFWFVKPEKRGSGMKLLFALENLARERGCARMHMVHLLSINADSLSKTYERIGYKPTEIHYVKELN